MLLTFKLHVSTFWYFINIIRKRKSLFCFVQNPLINDAWCLVCVSFIDKDHVNVQKDAKIKNLRNALAQQRKKIDGIKND